MPARTRGLPGLLSPSYKPPYRHLTYIVGHARGGTTWLGELFATHPRVRYIFEPFASKCQVYTGIDTHSLFNNDRQFMFWKRRRMTDRPSKSFISDSTNGELQPLLPLVRFHLERLVGAYFEGQKGFHLVIKQPRVENLGWAVHAIRPDLVVFIDRHPFGVVNSYARSTLWSWLGAEWDFARQTIPPRYPKFRRLFEDASTPHEKELVLTYIRSFVGRERCSKLGKRAWVIQYESLCDAPASYAETFARKAGLEWSAEAELKLKAKLEETSGGDRGLYDTRKEPGSRKDAWKQELPRPLISKLVRFSRRNKLHIPF